MVTRVDAPRPAQYSTYPSVSLSDEDEGRAVYPLRVSPSSIHQAVLFADGVLNVSRSLSLQTKKPQTVRSEAD